MAVLQLLLPSRTHSSGHLSLNSFPFWPPRSCNPFPNPNPSVHPGPTKQLNSIYTHLTLSLSPRSRNLFTTFISFEEAEKTEAPNPKLLLRFAVSAVIVFLGFFGFGLARRPPPALAAAPLQEEIQDQSELRTAFEAWKSKPYALTVPLTIVALRGSLPPSWVKDFIQSQGKRVKFHLKYNASLEGIFSDLCMTSRKGHISPSSTMAADLVSVGDSWLSFAINKGVIEPMHGVEDQEWFKGLSDKWKVYLRRNFAGEIDPVGKIWAAPYRWGCMVIAYKISKFQKHKLAPIEDWADLWRPELEGRISMVDSPREVVGAVLKYMGASYNTNNLDLQVAGGRSAIQKNLQLLGRQVRLFDSVNYLKAFGVGDVWVAVGWSADVIPLAKRSSNVVVVVPKSGASLWADLWAIPAASRIETNRIGGRVRGASPLIHQWIEFCLQAARALPFKQEVIPGASPAALESTQIEMPTELAKGKPRLDTNLIAGVPPTDILASCEFLEPLSDSTLSDYQWLISSIQKPGHSFIHRMHDRISMMIQSFWLKRNMH